MKREQRQAKILDLIAQYEVETQEELAAMLREMGEKVTQATVSRDIKELGLIKVMKGDKYRYSYVDKKEPKLSAKLINVFKESVISVKSSLNLIVVNTLSGTANAAAVLIDKLDLPEILGCIAGDDTILVITKSPEDSPTVLDKLEQIISQAR